MQEVPSKNSEVPPTKHSEAASEISQDRTEITKTVIEEFQRFFFQNKALMNFQENLEATIRTHLRKFATIR